MGHLFDIVAISSLLAVAACAATGDVPERERANAPREQVEAPRAQSQTYYFVTRRDFRKCMYPMCGGVFVAEVNNAKSKCADNTNAEDCYVSDLDLSALALTPEMEAEVASLAGDGHVLLRGELVAEETQFGTIGKLVADAAWRGATLSKAADPTYLLIDSGIVCFTFPCFSLTQIALNSSVNGSVSGVDLVASGASQQDQSKAQALLGNAGLIVSGTHINVSGPAGEGDELVTSEIFFPVTTAKCGQNTCGAGEFCCNESCGICAPEGGFCTEQACGGCGHSECNPGAALASSCSTCATKVCNADAFCCSNSWDALCVKEAAQLCDVCEQAPPPVCAHDECKPGEKLEQTCSTCATDVCNQDAFCCNNTWDALCVEQATELCSTCAAAPAPVSCAHSECSEGGVLDASCSGCAGIVCDADAFCCNSGWDKLCVDEATSWCASTCG